MKGLGLGESDTQFKKERSKKRTKKISVFFMYFLFYFSFIYIDLIIFIKKLFILLATIAFVVFFFSIFST